MTDHNNAAQAAEKAIRAAITLLDGDLDHENAETMRALLSKLRAEGAQAGDERAAFEAWNAKHGEYRRKDAYEREENGSYVEWPVEREWRTWQARAALASAPVAGEAQPTAYLTLDEEGSPCMLFFDEVEARTYCAPDEEPEPLFRHAAPQASEAQCSCPSGDGSLRHPCAVHPQASDAVRNQALEEAAQTAYKALFPTNDRSDWTEFAESASFNAKYAAQCIRALKSQSAALSAQPGAQRTGGSDAE